MQNVQVPLLKVWSMDGPVLADPVGPFALVQSNLSDLSWV